LFINVLNILFHALIVSGIVLCFSCFLWVSVWI